MYVVCLPLMFCSSQTLLQQSSDSACRGCAGGQLLHSGTECHHCARCRHEWWVPEWSPAAACRWFACTTKWCSKINQVYSPHSDGRLVARGATLLPSHANFTPCLTLHAFTRTFHSVEAVAPGGCPTADSARNGDHAAMPHINAFSAILRSIPLVHSQAAGRTGNPCRHNTNDHQGLTSSFGHACMTSWLAARLAGY